ncbi:NAD-glutamate dehydrogenase [Ferrimonas sp. YFM]|uniref:NAD-glutamate dehydrogenase n=1 Tax=Ferrimonas sp. YFM TaxID=3028878 RepID=UPI002574669C|nr:NAD-glutamate dehydrogenase [Ferrimonas sp. YFM]BDY05035.1 NAD-glutamate dehydrogenase [Ferrimonas sp. YFM]
MANNDTIPSVLLENVVGLIHNNLPKQDAILLERFAHALYGTLSRDDLYARSDSDLYGAILSLWNSLNQVSGGKTFSRVFNPLQSTHGWQSNHTVIEMIQPDMPFLVDSVAMAFNRLGVTSHLMIHVPLAIQRDKKGRVVELRSLAEAKANDERIAVFLIEVDSLSTEEEVSTVHQELNSVVTDVAASVNDWDAMRAQLGATVREMEENDKEGKHGEATEFLKFLLNHHFTLLGFRRYDLVPVSGDVELTPQMETGLGMMRSKDDTARHLLLSTLPESARREALGPAPLVLTKTNSKSRVHRPAYIDYIGVKRFDKEGRVVGEDRFIGLYASSVYNRSPREIPLLSAKLNRVMERSRLAPRSHDYKALLNVLETYPRDELIQANEQELLEIGLGVLQMQDRDKVRLFLRKDLFGRFISAMVYVSKDRYNTQLRVNTQKLLAEYFSAEEEVEFTTFFSESILARTHYLVKVEDNDMDIDVPALENNLVELTRSWEDKVDSALRKTFGQAKGKAIANNYLPGFPRSYKEDVLPSAAVVDVAKLEKLNDSDQLGMLFYQPQEAVLDANQVRLKLFHKDEPIHLSDVLPMLENFGLRVIGERPYCINTADGQVYWVLDFNMTLSGKTEVDINAAQARFQEAFAKVWARDLEDDGFNRLILSAGMTGREASVLRSYAKYMRQIDGTFSQTYVEETLAEYPHIASLLVKMFDRKFNPGSKAKRDLEKQIEQANTYLDDVSNLDDDRIIRRYISLIQATLRTNFYQHDDKGHPKSYVSYKFSPAEIPEMPLPLPKFEIFVYSPRVEGVHLRGAKVARGGLRWSDRREDFRTEVLGLVKAQQVKNTVIVPSGAKGGFVCKNLPTDRDGMLAEGQACYKIFISALLDITDNIVAGQLTPPDRVVRHDEDDPYLVVAADKGTATFSDIANAISESYDFWLGDAFASGGQYGYDHKKMGITARGAWESVKRHFRELGVNCQTTDFTVLGVGDMGGDVFGNGMLLSRHIRLQAAFNHMHIFIDPNPDSATSYAERERLFKLPRSTWEDYNSELISEGGGVFNRSAKSIKLTPQIKAMIGTNKNQMAPNELIRQLLMMEVDLLWNGGIGTYVKAVSETDADVGDRANDVLRVNGSELRAKVVGEGGNLGLTQLGRIEYAKRGGRINTDFIDNVGGVDCSDNEVNIKILLNQLVAQGDLTIKQRNQLLEKMTDEVAEIVLQDCRDQAQSISVTEVLNSDQLKEQIRFMQHLEKAGKLDRALEFLPNEDELNERQLSGVGLTRPELSVLVAYAKMVLKEQLVSAEITDNEFLARRLVEYFPVELQQRFSEQMATHPLRGEIIATSLANDIINEMGLNFIQRMQDETGAAVEEVAICYTVSCQVFDLEDLKRQINALDDVDAHRQSELLNQVRRTLRRVTRWFLRHRNRSLSIEAEAEFYRGVVEELDAGFDGFLVEDEVAQLSEDESAMVEQGITPELARRMSHLSTLFSALDIAEVAKSEGKPVALVAETYFKLGAGIELHWFLNQISQQPVTNHWQALARAAFREDLDWQQRMLTSVVLKNCQGECSADAIINQWVEENEQTLDRWLHMMAEFHSSKTHEFAKFSVALRELNLLIMRCNSHG